MDAHEIYNYKVANNDKQTRSKLLNSVSKLTHKVANNDKIHNHYELP